MATALYKSSVTHRTVQVFSNPVLCITYTTPTSLIPLCTLMFPPTSTADISVMSCIVIKQLFFLENLQQRSNTAC